MLYLKFNFKDPSYTRDIVLSLAFSQIYLNIKKSEGYFFSN